MLLLAKQTDRTGAPVYWMLGYGLLTGLKTQVGAEQPGATQTRLASLTGPQTEKLWNREPPYTLTTNPNSAEVLNAPQNLCFPDLIVVCTQGCVRGI